VEWLLTLLTAAGLLLLFGISEELLRRRLLPPEKTRRMVHSLGAGACATFPLYLRLRDVLLLAGAFTIFLTLTWRRHGLRSIHAVDRPTAGALVFPAGLALAALAVWSHPRAFAFGALVLALGDPAAAIVGTTIGGPGWHVAGGRKTFAGSVALWLVVLLLAIVFGSLSGELRPSDAIAAATVLATVEGTIGYGLDNLPLPIVAAVLGELLLGL
jgi:dolichol kinase